MKDTVFYFYDALCSWCYGFSPVIKKFREDFGNDYQVEVISGGMQSGDRKQPVSDIKDYLKGAYKNVTDRTGVEFGEKFMEVLEDGHRILDSVPPSIALSVVKDVKPEKALDFASSIQEAIYYSGIDWNNPEAYVPYAENIGIERELFLNKFGEEKYLQKAREDFKMAGDFGINGFPSVVLKRDDKFYLIARGFIPYKQLIETIKEINTIT